MAMTSLRARATTENGGFVWEKDFFLQEAKFVAAASSKESGDVSHLWQHLSGSMVAFRRERRVTPGKIQYLHTGVLLRGRRGNVRIMEMECELGLHGTARVGVTLAKDVLKRGGRPSAPGATMSVRNGHLQQRGIDIRLG